MRVVDDHLERLALVDRLEAAGDAPHRLEAPCDGLVGDPEEARRGDRAERVLDVEAAAELELDAVEGVGPDLRVVVEPEGERVRPLGGELPAPRVIDVDRGGRGLGLQEEAPLRFEVALHRAVEVEVVRRQVREDERGEADAVEAVERGGVRGGLHRAAFVAGVEHLAEGALEVDRLGRRADDRPPLAGHARLDRAEEARPAARRGEDRVDEVRGRRLTVRAGDADDVELVRRVAEEDVGRDGHGRAAVVDHELWHLRVYGPLDDERRGAGRDRLRRELVPVDVRAADAEEERTGRERARVVGQIRYVERSTTDDVPRRERCDDALEVHRRASLPARSAHRPLRASACALAVTKQVCVAATAGVRPRPRLELRRRGGRFVADRRPV